MIERKKTNTVVIIGLGNIGSRHLEAVLKSKYKLEIFCVDVLPHINIMSDVDGKKVLFVRTIEQLPSQIDIAIISTTSDARYRVFCELTEKRIVKAIIFEKVLFQRIEEYYKADKLIRSKGISAWVNCPRRVSSSWIGIKKMVEDSDILSVRCYGGDWGIACNAVHFLDFIQWISDKVTVDITDVCIDGEVFESRRPGFKEFYGSISGQCGRCKYFTLECKNDRSPFEIEIICDRSRIKIVNNQTEAIRIGENSKTGSDRIKMEPVYVSQTTMVVLDDIINRGFCNLTCWPDSMVLHLEFIEKLMTEMEKKGVTKDVCPIT